MKMATQFQAMMWFHNTTFFTKLTTSPTEYTIKFLTETLQKYNAFTWLQAPELHAILLNPVSRSN